MIKKLDIYVSGIVQGVGYRSFVVRKAKHLDIKGTVRNLYDGRVLVKAVGEKDNMEHFLIQLQKGPSWAYVDRLQVKESETIENYEEFTVEY